MVARYAAESPRQRAWVAESAAQIAEEPEESGYRSAIEEMRGSRAAR